MIRLSGAGDTREVAEQARALRDAGATGFGQLAAARSGDTAARLLSQLHTALEVTLLAVPTGASPPQVQAHEA
jgi:hypothetical protein